MAHGQAEGAEVHLSQALAHQDSLEDCLGRAESSEEAETVLDLLFSLLVERLQNAWTLQQPVRLSHHPVTYSAHLQPHQHTCRRRGAVSASLSEASWSGCGLLAAKGVLGLLFSLLVERLQTAWTLQQPARR